MLVHACIKILIAVFLLASGPALSATTNDLDFQRAIELFEKGDYKSSEVILQKLVDADRSNGVYWFNLGNVFYSMKKYARATRCYETVIKLGEQGKTTLAPMAMLYLAKTYRQSGESESAIETLEKLKSIQPPVNIARDTEEELDLLKPEDDVVKDMADEGMAHYKNQRYEEALKVFKDVMKFKPTPEAAMMVGLSHLQISEPQKASFAFSRVLKLRPTAELRATTLELINQIKNDLWPKIKKWWLWVDTAYGYNSNIFENGFSEAHFESPLLLGIFDVGYHIVKKKPWTVDVGYQFFILDYKNFPGWPGWQKQVHGISVPTDFQNRSWMFQVVPYFKSETTGGLPLQKRLGASGKIHRFMDSFGAGIAYNFSHAKAGNSYFSYLTGDVVSLESYLEYVDGRFSVMASYTYLTEGLGDYPYNGGTFPQDATSQGPGVYLSWLISPQWQVQLNGIYWNKNYGRLATPEGKKRKDNQTYTSARISFFATSLLTFYLNQEAIFNNSTLTAGDVADCNFTKMITYLGIKWNIVQ